MVSSACLSISLSLSGTYIPPLSSRECLSFLFRRLFLPPVGVRQVRFKFIPRIKGEAHLHIPGRRRMRTNEDERRRGRRGGRRDRVKTHHVHESEELVSEIECVLPLTLTLSMYYTHDYLSTCTSPLGVYQCTMLLLRSEGTLPNTGPRPFPGPVADLLALP